MRNETLSICILSLALVAGCDRFFSPYQSNNARASKVSLESSNFTDDYAYINQQINSLSGAGLGGQQRELNFQLIQNSNYISSKLLYASRFIEAFDFQLWNMTTDSRILNSPLKDNYGEMSIKELTRFIPNLRVNHPPLSALATGNNMANFYAITASLHKINMYQDIFRKNYVLNNQSILDFIETSLSKESGVRSGEIPWESLTKTDIEVLKSTSTFRYTLMIRHRLLPLLALGRITQMNDTVFFKIRNLLKKSIPETADLYTYNFNTRMLDVHEAKSERKDYIYHLVKNTNLVQLFYANELLKESIRTRNFLKKIGNHVFLDSSVYVILSNLRLLYSDISNISDTQLAEAKLRLIDDFNLNIKEILNE